MPNIVRKCTQIQQIVKLRQLLRRWRHKATASSSSNRFPSDVPAGHVAVNVGSSSKRFVVRATYLNHPMFKKLLAQAEEAYGGFTNQRGPLSIPCDESLFQDILWFLSRSESRNSSSARVVTLEDFQRHFHYHLQHDFWPESWLLLADK